MISKFLNLEQFYFQQFGRYEGLQSTAITPPKNAEDS